MNLNVYYGVKEADDTASFSQAQWLSPNALFRQLRINPSPHASCLALGNELHTRIYPSELIVDERRRTYDLLLIAKYTDGIHGSLKLKSVFLSQLIADYCSDHRVKLYVLSVPKVLGDCMRASRYNTTLIRSHF